MSARVDNNSVPNPAAGTTAPPTTEKRTARIANGILRFFKATESGPIRQSVTVGFGVGVFFLGIGGVFGALVGFIHGIFASIKLHNLRVKEKRGEFQNLKARVEEAIKDDKPFSPPEAIALILDIIKFHDKYNELCIFDDDDMDNEVWSAKDSILQRINKNGKAQTAYDQKLALVTSRVETFTKQDSFSLTSGQAKNMDSELEQLDQYALLNISVNKENIRQLRRSIRTFIQKHVENIIKDMNENIKKLNEAHEGWSPELHAKAKNLDNEIKSLKKYNNFLSKNIKDDLSKTSIALQPIIIRGNAELIRLEEQVELYITTYKSDDILQDGPDSLIEEIKTFTCVYGKEKVGKLIERLFPFTAAGQHIITDLSKETSMATIEREATLEALK